MSPNILFESSEVFNFISFDFLVCDNSYLKSAKNQTISEVEEEPITKDEVTECLKMSAETVSDESAIRSKLKVLNDSIAKDKDLILDDQHFDYDFLIHNFISGMKHLF